jgi:hypothetical protein
MLKGSCCCQIVEFELKEEPSLMGTCHCSRCRKVGASTIVFISKNSLEIIKGEEFIGAYLPEEGYKYKRNFCTHCGTSLGEILSEEESFPIPANIIDSELKVEHSFHEFEHEKPKWQKI